MRRKFHDRLCTNTFYFNWPNFLSVGIVNISFQCAGTGRYATPTRHFKFPLRTFSGKLQTFPMVKSKTIGFLLDRTQKFFSEQFRMSSGKRAAKLPLCGLFKSSWHVLPYKVHVTELSMLWKLLKALCRILLVLYTCVSHQALVERGKELVLLETVQA